MRKFITIIILVFLFSCSNDESDEVSVIGTWQLTTWSIQVSIDLNNDMSASLNLLDEASCSNNEILVFDAIGVVSSNMTYNPKVTISLLDGTTDHYLIDVDCDTEGVIGTIGEYSIDEYAVTLFNTTGMLNGNQLTLVYEDAIDVYNESITEVITTKDLRLVYTKK